MYSYGNRRLALGKAFMSNWLLLLLVAPHLTCDLMKGIGYPIAQQYAPVFLVVYAVPFVWLAIRVIQSYRPKLRPDLPSGIEISDTGTLRLFQEQEMYAEVAIGEIASLKDVTLDVLPWDTANASQLTLKSPVQGLDHIYVLPHLMGYSEFISKLLDISPTLRPVHEGPEWASTPAGSPVGSFAILGVLAAVLMVLIVTIALGGHGRANQWTVWGEAVVAIAMLAAVVAAVLIVVKEAKERVTMISIYPDKMQVVRSSVWHVDVRPEEITGLEIIPAGTWGSERLKMRTRKGRFYISAEFTKGYPELVRRIEEFAGRSARTRAFV